jgi:hypothetical protein
MKCNKKTPVIIIYRESIGRKKNGLPKYSHSRTALTQPLPSRITGRIMLLQFGITLKLNEKLHPYLIFLNLTLKEFFVLFPFCMAYHVLSVLGLVLIN